MELKQIRADLRKELAPVQDIDLDWAPKEGMKSYRALLKEIGAIQVETSIFVREGRVPPWEEAESYVTGDTVAQIVASLDHLLDELVEFLSGQTDADFDRFLDVKDWEWFFGTSQIEPDEMVRWVARHEYYHLGQIVTYNWMRGLDPYKAT